MKIEFPVIHSESLIYFLIHGGTFVLVMGTLFFLLGLFFGACTWGLYKRRSKALKRDNEAQRQEIASLKRKLAEQTLRPAIKPLPEMPHLVREPAPVASDFINGDPFEYPALAALPTPPGESHAVAAAKRPLPVVAEAAPASRGRPPARKSPTMAKLKNEAPVPAGMFMDSAPAADEGMEDDEPFGVLLGEPEDSAHQPASSISALTAIIKGSATAVLAAAPSMPEPTRESPPQALLPEVPAPRNSHEHL